MNNTELPPLPECWSAGSYREDFAVYTADQMRDYAMAALASQASKGAGVPEGWRVAIDGLMDFAPSNRGPLSGMTRGGDYVRKADVIEALAYCVPSPAQAQPVASQRPSDDDLWDQTLRERDYNAEMADKLASAIGDHLGRDIGEHSSGHCPWLAALEMLNEAQPVASQPIDLLKHLKGAADAVKDWPDWKKNIWPDNEMPTKKQPVEAVFLAELLARIHRDGGQHQVAVGTEQAFRDADAIVVKWLAGEAQPVADAAPAEAKRDIPADHAVFSATTFWLDAVGADVKMPRNPGEACSDYRHRIIAKMRADIAAHPSPAQSEALSQQHEDSLLLDWLDKHCVMLKRQLNNRWRIVDWDGPENTAEKTIRAAIRALAAKPAE
jgi:hypothetical protein